MTFNKAFDGLDDWYDFLCQFCGVLAVPFANTISLLYDFPILKWNSKDHRTTLTNL